MAMVYKNLAGTTANQFSLGKTNEIDFRTNNGIAEYRDFGGAWMPFRNMTGVLPYMFVRDEKPSGTNGGTFTSSAWRTRDINTVVSNTIPGASLSTNQIILPAGTYYINGMVPAHRVANHKAVLYNVTDNVNILIGSTECISSTNMSCSYLIGVFTLEGTKNLEIMHRCSTNRNTDGFGLASNYGVIEIYTAVEFWKNS